MSSNKISNSAPDIDKFLWSKVREGDTEAFQFLFEKYYAVLCLLSKRYTNDIDSSREIIQGLFIKLWEKRSELTISVSVKSYLYQSARFNTIRHVYNNRRFAGMSETKQEQAFEDHIEYAELQEKIIRTIDALPDQCKRVFKLSRFEHFKQNEIAQLLGISIKTVESHIRKALRLLEQKLQEDFV